MNIGCQYHLNKCQENKYKSTLDKNLGNDSNGLYKPKLQTKPICVAKFSNLFPLLSPAKVPSSAHSPSPVLCPFFSASFSISPSSRQPVAGRRNCRHRSRRHPFFRPQLTTFLFSLPPFNTPAAPSTGALFPRPFVSSDKSTDDAYC